MSANAVLGHYPAYVDVADALGAARFAVPAAVWIRWSAQQGWAHNRQFLDESARRGRFLTTTSPFLARPGSAYARKVGYLLNQGYRMVPSQRVELL